MKPLLRKADGGSDIPACRGGFPRGQHLLAVRFVKARDGNSGADHGSAAVGRAGLDSGGEAGVDSALLRCREP